LTDDGKVEITGRDLRQRDYRACRGSGFATMYAMIDQELA
jgi:hypothetical protein